MKAKMMRRMVFVTMLFGVMLPVAQLVAQETTPNPTTRPGVPASGARGRSGGGARGGFAGGGFAGPRGGFAPSANTSSEGPACTLDATVYDLRLAGDQIGRLDLNALSGAAGTPESFEKALSALGTTQPIYRANQSVRLAHDSISIGTTSPYISNSQTTAQGNVINSVSYSDTGAMFDLVGKISGGAIELNLDIQVSTLADGTTEIRSGVKAPMFRKITMAHRGPVEPRKPFVVVSVDAANVDASGKAVAYIARVVLGEPQSTGAGGDER